MRELHEGTIPRRHILILSLLLIAAALPHTLNLAPSVMTFFFAMMAARLVIYQRRWRTPGRLLKVALTLIGLFMVLLHYRSIAGYEAGTALLTVMLGLKMLEVHARRDLYLTIFLTWFLIITLFLFDQGILLTLYLLLVVWGLVALLIAMNRVITDERAPLPLREAGGMLLQAVPLMVVMFLLFPRFGPLWSMPFDTSIARSGLSNSLSPGSFEKLVQSHQTAFRVHFEEENIPPPQERYWRGPVMWWSDGREWRVTTIRADENARFTPLGDPIHYSVTLEPSPTRWLLALDLPTGAVPGAFYTKDFQVVSRSDIDATRRYRLTSYPDYRMEEITPEEWQMGLQLPNNITPRMRELVAEWQPASRSPEQVVEQALNHFRDNPFYYTLEPPGLGRNPVDEFLFESRRGFCEHYAAAFVTLMRLAGIPSRIVTGYQGGELNPVGNYLIVRHSDAHAWSELWLEGRGWVRVDPTAAVAPERILSSIDPTSLLSGREINYRQAGMGIRLELLIDSINARWNRWILSYDNSSQSWLLMQLGIEYLETKWKFLLIIAFSLFLLSLGTWWINARNRPSSDPLRRLYDRFCSAPLLHNYPRQPQEGPHDYAQRTAAQLPAHAAQILAISQLYITLRYGRSGSDPQQMERLKERINAFYKAKEDKKG